METELARTDSTALNQIPQDEPQSILAVIARAAADPRVDVEKMRALLDMQFKVQARDAEVEFNAALARLMPKIPRIQKNGVIFNKDGHSVRSKYAFYEEIDEAVRPLLAEEGFAISFDTDDSIAGQVRIIGTLAHRMGFSRKSQITLPTHNPVISGAQAVGATTSYGKRYIVINLLNIITVGEDNDAQGDTKKINAEQVLMLETMLQDTKSDRNKFFQLVGVGALEEILEANLAMAIRLLAAKKKQ